MPETFSVLNELKSNDFNNLQSQNMLFILVTFLVLNEDKLSSVKDEQLLNIYDILVTSWVLNLEKSVAIIFSQPLNMYEQLDNLPLITNLIENVPLLEGIKDFEKGTFFPSIINVVLLSFISFKLSCSWYTWLPFSK